MSNLLDAANVSTNKFIIGELPTKPGEVSIMTLGQMFKALGGSSEDVYDPSGGYDTSTYYVYSINEGPYPNCSTLDDLQDIDINWYRQLNKPTTDYDNYWTVGSHKLFGGPFDCIYCYGYLYDLGWYYLNSNDNDGAYGSDYWEGWVPDSVYIAVVHT